VKPTIIAVAFAVLSFAASRSARGQLQTVIPSTGPEVFPGRFQLSINPIGPQVLFADRGGTTTLYKLGLNFEGRVLSRNKLTLWAGGELNFGGAPLDKGAQLAEVEPGVFVELSFEEMIGAPIVPFLRAGLSGGILTVYDVPMSPSSTNGAFWVKLGGGFHYFPVRNVGIGFLTDLALGTSIASAAGRAYGGFLGYWDLLAQLVIAF